MIREVRLRPEAEQDLLDAAAWYEQRRVNLGNEFLDEILAVFSTITETPFMYPVIHRNTRRAIVQHFPFGVHYRVEPDAIVVIAVIHGSRNPRRWKSRT